MAAVVLAPHPAPRRSTLRLVAPGARDLRPATRSVTPPPRTRPTPVTYWRRRFLTLLVLTSLAVVAHLGANALLDRPDEVSIVTAPLASTSAAPAVADPGVVPAPRTYVVRPGDTMWSIAADLQPDGDLRALVDQLTERAGGSGLQAGQRIALDGLGL